MSPTTWLALLGAIGFAMFTMFWTALTLLLTGPAWGLPEWAIGLFGLARAAGAISAIFAGRAHDRGRGRVMSRLAWCVAAVAWGIALPGLVTLVPLIVALILLDGAAQTQHSLNQIRIFALAPDARSRVNSVYLTGYFFGGAVGSLAASLLWPSFGWPGVVVAGVVAALAGLAVWLVRPPE